MHRSGIVAPDAIVIVALAVIVSEVHAASVHMSEAHHVGKVVSVDQAVKLNAKIPLSG